LAAEIIDFKTDALDPGNAAQLAERIAFYSPQLQAYRDAVSTFTGLSAERITVTLAFVQAGVVRSV
jgi:ATP-dependent exoDNAse (exonuclease V) beta subunit